MVRIPAFAALAAAMIAALAACSPPSYVFFFERKGAPNVVASTGPLYYLAATGNDSNPGTQAQPWKTINAIDSHKPYPAGTQFLFKSGETFAGSLYIDSKYISSPSSSNPVIVSSYGSGKATISSTTDGIFIHNLAGVEIRNINIVGGGAGVSNGKGIRLGHDLPNTVISHIVIDNVDISGFSGKAFGSGIGIAMYSGTNTSLWQNIRVTNSALHDNTVAGLQFWGYVGYEATSNAYYVVKTISNIYLGNLKAYNHPGVVNLAGAGSGIILSGVIGGTVEYCVAYNNGQNNTTSAGPYGIWTYESDQMTIQFNESYSNHTQGAHDGGGFDLDGGTTNSILQYNYAHNNDGTGFLVNQYIGGNNTQNNTVRYNISENNNKIHEAGITVHADIGANLIGTNIHNNTIYNGSGAAATSGILVFGGSTNTTIRNNTIVTTGGKPLLTIADTHTGLVIQGNDYWPSGGSFVISYGGATKTSLFQFANDTGQERNRRTGRDAHSSGDDREDHQSHSRDGL